MLAQMGKGWFLWPVFPAAFVGHCVLIGKGCAGGVSGCLSVRMGSWATYGCWAHLGSESCGLFLAGFGAVLLRRGVDAGLVLVRGILAFKRKCAWVSGLVFWASVHWAGLVLAIGQFNLRV